MSARRQKTCDCNCNCNSSLSLSACRSPLAAVGSLARAEVTEGGSGCGPVEGVEVVEARAASQEEQLGQGLEHCTAERDGSFCLF